MNLFSDPVSLESYVYAFWRLWKAVMPVITAMYAIETYGLGFIFFFFRFLIFCFTSLESRVDRG